MARVTTIRWIRLGVIVLGSAMALVLAALWYCRPHVTQYFTDGTQVWPVPAGAAPVRSILWEPGTPLLAPVNAKQANYQPRLSPDGTELYFTRGRRGDDGGGSADLYVARRTANGWGAPAPLTTLNTDADEIGATLSSDGSTLAFYSDRPGGLGGYDIWFSRRDASGAWGPPVNAGAPVNSAGNDYDPAFARGGRLLFASDRRSLPPPGTENWQGTLRERRPATSYDLFAADPLPGVPLPLSLPGRGAGVRVGAGEGAQPATSDPDAGNPHPVPAGRDHPLPGREREDAPPAPAPIGSPRFTVRSLDALNTDRNEGQPVVSGDGDFLYFSSDRPGGQGGYDLYRARINSDSLADFGPVQNLGAPTNTAANEMDPCPSVEGFALYFSSDRATASLAQPLSLPGRGAGVRVGADEDAQPAATDLDAENPHPVPAGRDHPLPGREREEVVASAPTYHLYYTRSREVLPFTVTARNDLGRVWARMNWPTAGVVLSVLAMVLMVAAFLNFRRRPGLMATLLMLSIMLHLGGLIASQYQNIYEHWTSGPDEASIQKVEISLDELSGSSDLTARIRNQLAASRAAPARSIAAPKAALAEEPPPADLPTPQPQVARAEPVVEPMAELRMADLATPDPVAPPDQPTPLNEQAPTGVEPMRVKLEAPTPPRIAARDAQPTPTDVRVARSAPRSPDRAADMPQPIPDTPQVAVAPEAQPQRIPLLGVTVPTTPAPAPLRAARVPQPRREPPSPVPMPAPAIEAPPVEQAQPTRQSPAPADLRAQRVQSTEDAAQARPRIEQESPTPQAAPAPTLSPAPTTVSEATPTQPAEQPTVQTASQPPAPTPVALGEAAPAPAPAPADAATTVRDQPRSAQLAPGRMETPAPDAAGPAVAMLPAIATPTPQVAQSSAQPKIAPAAANDKPAGPASESVLSGPAAPDQSSPTPAIVGPSAATPDLDRSSGDARDNPAPANVDVAHVAVRQKIADIRPSPGPTIDTAKPVLADAALVSPTTVSVTEAKPPRVVAEPDPTQSPAAQKPVALPAIGPVQADLPRPSGPADRNDAPRMGSQFTVARADAGEPSESFAKVAPAPAGTPTTGGPQAADASARSQAPTPASRATPAAPAETLTVATGPAAEQALSGLAIAPLAANPLRTIAQPGEEPKAAASGGRARPAQVASGHATVRSDAPQSTQGVTDAAKEALSRGGPSAPPAREATAAPSGGLASAAPAPIDEPIAPAVGGPTSEVQKLATVGPTAESPRVVAAGPSREAGPQGHGEVSVARAGVLADAAGQRPTGPAAVAEAIPGPSAGPMRTGPQTAPPQGVAGTAAPPIPGPGELLAAATPAPTASLTPLAIGPAAQARPVGPAKEEYALRRTPNKEAVIEKLGGSKQTEDAVKEALEWLARHQDEDGKWNVDHFNKHDVGEKTDGAGSRTGEDAGVTGLALLSFLGAGHVHNAEGPHRDVVRKALDYLITGQDAKGDLRRGGQMYAQGIACMALCEAYGLSGDPGLEAPARRAAQFILDAQTPGAGWRYQPRVQSDTSVLGWQLMALRSAEIAGLKLDTRKAHEGSSRWLDQVAKGDRGGHYQYQPGRGVTPTMTAEGLFCRMVIGEPLAQASRDESVALILANLPQRKPGDREATNLYYWYYATLVMHSIGGQEWDRWNDAMRPVLISLQRQDGNAKGSFNPVTRWGSFGGRVYSTAMAAMILEVYYRYLPFYREGAPPEATPAARP